MSLKRANRRDATHNLGANKTILYVSSSGDLMGGAERCLVDLATGIEQYGWRPLVVVPFHGALADTLVTAGVPVQVSELGVFRSRREMRSPTLLIRLASMIPAIVRLAALIRRARVTIVHSNTSVVLAGAVAARLTGRPHIWHVREILSGPTWRFLRRIILTLSDRVVCISAAVADNVAPLGSPERARVVVIPDGIDLRHFSPATSPVHADKCRVGMVARITPWKGHDVFLQAACIVAQRIPNAEFFLVGGHLPAYETLFARLFALRSELGLDHRVRFIDHVDRHAARDFLASLAVVVVPSTLPEPGGLVALEAMALGRPVVATRHGGPLDFITDGVNGRLVTPNDAPALADAIIALLQDAATRQALGVAARQTIEREYDLPRQMERLTMLYDAISQHAGHDDHAKDGELP